MNKSKVPIIAKAIIKALNKSESKSVELYVHENRYKVVESGSDAPEWSKCSFKGMNGVIVEYSYPDGNIPAIEEIEESLIKYFIKINN